MEFRKSPKSGADTLFKLGQAYENLGDPARAAHYYEQVTGFTEHPRYYDAQESLRRGRLVTWEHPDTIADGLRVTHLGDLPFALIAHLVDDIVAVTDDEIRAAVLALHRGARLVVEPSGAVAMAALMHEKTGVEGRRTVAILSGGNIDPALLARWLTK